MHQLSILNPRGNYVRPLPPHASEADSVRETERGYFPVVAEFQILRNRG